MATLGLNVTNLILNKNHFDLNVYIFDIRLKYVFYLNERFLYLVWLCRFVHGHGVTNTRIIAKTHNSTVVRDNESDSDQAMTARQWTTSKRETNY